MHAAHNLTFFGHNLILIGHLGPDDIRTNFELVLAGSTYTYFDIYIGERNTMTFGLLLEHFLSSKIIHEELHVFLRQLT